MILPCGHDEFQLRLDSCRVCQLFQTRSEYAEMFRSNTIESMRTVIVKPCVDLGDMTLPESIVSESFSKGVILYLNDSGKLSAFGQLPPDWVTFVAGWVEHRDLVADYLKQPTAQHAKNIRSVLIAQAKYRLNVPCVHLGPLVEKHPACGCGARHECAKHGSCVLTGATNRWAVCSRCTDFEASS